MNASSVPALSHSWHGLSPPPRNTKKHLELGFISRYLPTLWQGKKNRQVVAFAKRAIQKDIAWP